MSVLATPPGIWWFLVVLFGGGMIVGWSSYQDVEFCRATGIINGDGKRR